MAGILYFYDRENFDDNSPLQITHDEPDLSKIRHGLGNWNDEMESFKVISGQWMFYEHINFRGPVGPFGPGTEGNAERHGIPKKWVSSVKKIGD